MYRFMYLFLWLFCSYPLVAQELVDLKKAELIEVIRKSYPGFVQDNNSVNNSYKYLKFEDRISQETLFCFLSPDDVCTKTKLMSDYANLDTRIKFLNKQYKKRSPTSWTYTKNATDYVIALKKEEWYFTISTTRKQITVKSK